MREVIGLGMEKMVRGILIVDRKVMWVVFIVIVWKEGLIKSGSYRKRMILRVIKEVVLVGCSV